MINRFIFKALCIFTYLCTHFSHAQVVVTPGTFPTMCQGGGYVLQTSPIVIAETSPGDFGINPSQAFYYIQFSTGYEFYPVGYTVTNNAGGDVTNLQYQYYSNGILFYYDCPTNTKKDTIKISGVLLLADVGAPATFNVVRLASPTPPEAVQNGNMVVNAKNNATINSTYPPPGLVPTISIPQNYFCSNDNNNYPISVSPAGGFITPNAAVTGTNYKPSSATIFYPSANALIYNYNYLGCQFTASTGAFVQVTPSPTLTDNDADNIICPGQSVTFTALPNTGAYRFQFLKNGTLVQGPSFIQNTYTTTTLSNGDVISVIQDTGPGTCSATVADAAFTVLTVPTPTVSVPTLPALLCSNNSNAYPVSVNPSGGTISGTGISGSNFMATLASVGSNTITYAGTYSGCAYSTTTNVNVAIAPTVTLISNDADNIICEGDHVTFSANTSGTANRYLFLKNGNGIQGPNGISSYPCSTLVDGDAISVTVDNGSATCPTTSAAVVTTVGKYPKAKFTWQNTCGTNTVDFTNTSNVPSGSTIISYAWDFNSIGVTNSTSINSSYTYTSANTYSARLTVISDKGCSDDTITRVYTLPGFTPTVSNPYKVDFTTSNQGWAYDGQNPSWGWGVAPAAFGQGGRKLWSTGQSSGIYNTNERSYLYGPCVNLSSLDKPMMALRLSSVMNGKPAGTILEVTTDEGLNWEKVGTTNVGQNWYNEFGIVSTPNSTLANGDPNNPSSQGWADNFPLELSRISLQKYAGKTSVRFRLNFASVSDVNAAKYAGFALDSVFIGNRNKLVLIEHFTNDNPKTILANTTIDNIRKERTKDIAVISYHTSFPNGSDYYNLLNTADPSARVLTYGVSSTPYSFFNATATNNYNSIGSGPLTDTNLVDVKTLDFAKFKLDLSTNIIPGTITTSTRITYVDNKPFPVPFVIYFAVVEDTASNDITENAVLRKMLPDAGGTYISKLWYINDTSTSTQIWSDPSIQINKKFGVVVFIQNLTTKEIYQAAYLKGSGNYGTHVVASNGNIISENFDVSLYPNPADNEIHIIYPTSIIEDYKWGIYDNMGRLLTSNINEKGLQSFTINTSTFSEGSYYLKISNSKNFIIKKLIIVR